MTFATFQAAGSNCSGRAQSGATALMSYVVNTRRDGARNWGIYNCFAGQERFLTRQGMRTFADAVGTDVEVLNGEGEWTKAEVREFGVQSLVEVTFRPGSRSTTKLRHRVVATLDHRWVTTNRGEVTDLRTGDLVEFVGAPESDLILDAWVAGFGFGDGTITSQGEAQVRLCGAKAEHLSRFVDAAPCGVYRPPSQNGDPTVIFHKGWFSDWKQLPTTSDPEWLASWLAGYLAADGSLLDKGGIRLGSQDAAAIDFVRDVAPLAGWMVAGLATSSVMETNYGTRAAPLQEMVLRPEGAFRVVDVADLGVAEPVYCAVVPDGEDFVLAHGIHTGNCRRIAGRAVRSTHSEGRAVDIGFSGVANPAGTRLVNALIANNARLAGRLGVQVIIWNRRIYSRTSPKGRRYAGVSPHTDHVHIELNWAAARGLTLATVRAAFGGAAPSAPATNKPSGVRLVAAWSAGRNGRWVNMADVRLLQQRLTAKGHRTFVDGKYGPGTRAMVLAYQRRFAALTNDGIAGNNTVNHLWR